MKSEQFENKNTPRKILTLINTLSMDMCYAG
jgi:hypothetical protein